MNYPVWELGFAPGLLMAVIAVIHVFVSHFAIGGGIFLTLTEYYACARNDTALLQYVKRHTRFFVLVTLVFGAMTGVGIWFTMGLINPAASSALIHLFVWFWAIEWIFFLIEVASAIVYYTTWDRVSQATHFMVGGIYLLSSYMSLVVINGILTFMLTPGNWLFSHNIWEGFFNPTYVPSLFARTSICVAQAGLYALVTGVFIKELKDRHRVVRYAGLWALAGILTIIPALIAYYQVLPLAPGALFGGIMPTTLTATVVLMTAGTALLALILLPIAAPRFFRLGFALAYLVIMLGFFGGAEFVRESVRKPWTIYGYLYGNALRLTEYPDITAKGGLVQNALFARARSAEHREALGEDVFRIACRHCHALDGYKGLRRTFTGMDRTFAEEVIARLQFLRGQMPPFPGNDTERIALARWLRAQTPPGAHWNNGRDVFQQRCAICHTIDSGYRSLYPLLESYTMETLEARIPTLGAWQKKMVPYSGNPEETRLLAEYIRSWYTTSQ